MDTKNFDAYEFIAVVIPGSVVALLLIFQWPDLKALIAGNGFSVGGLGLFTVIAFVLGHLLQGLGSIFESVFWAFRGMPTSWVRNTRQTLVSPAQRDTLVAKLAAMEGSCIVPEQTRRSHWQSMMSRAYGRVHDAGKSEKIDAFNRTYGLSRGLTSSFIAASICIVFLYPSNKSALLLSLSMAILSLWRMYTFGKRYARALIQAYIDL